MATDAYTRADETPLASPWVSDGLFGGLSLRSNAAKQTGAGAVSTYTGSTGTRSRAKITTLPETGNAAGVVICSNDNGQFYRAVLERGTPSIVKMDSYIGGYALLDTATVTPVAGDEIELFREGGDVVCRYAGAEVCRATDSARTTGTSGIVVESALGVLDDWADVPATSPATNLQFVAQPLDTTAGQTMAPFTVAARDGANVTDTSFTGNVTIALQVGTGTLAGTLTRAAVAGVATFNDISLSVLNADAVIRATSSGLTQIDSSPFDITAGGAGGGSLFGSGIFGS
jgi:hypothetical protein